MFGVSYYQKRRRLFCGLLLSTTTETGSWNQRAERGLIGRAGTTHPVLSLGPGCLGDRESPCSSPRSAPLGKTGQKDGLQSFKGIHWTGSQKEWTQWMNWRRHFLKQWLSKLFWQQLNRYFLGCNSVYVQHTRTLTAQPRLKCDGTGPCYVWWNMFYWHFLLHSVLFH